MYIPSTNNLRKKIEKIIKIKAISLLSEDFRLKQKYNANRSDSFLKIIFGNKQ